MTRYHPLLVALHWIMAVMVLVSLAAGGLVLAEMPRESPDRFMALAGHMTAGLVIGVLLIVRLLTRIRSEKPPPATAGNGLLDRLGVLTHWGFYVLIAGMVLSGLATAIGAGLFPIVFGSSGETLPGDLTVFPQRVAHGLIARLLLVLIALHVAAALYHQFVRRDGLLRRMWFGKRS